MTDPATVGVGIFDASPVTWVTTVVATFIITTPVGEEVVGAIVLGDAVVVV
jgi:hypothetical protein